MLRDEDLKRKKSWENWEGFRNLVFMTGVIKDANKSDKSFKLQQLESENSQVIVKFRKRDYYPKNFVNGLPVKIIGRVRQNPDLDYPSLITYPIKIACMPDSDALLEDTLNSSNNQPFVNRVQLAGFVYAKKGITADEVILSLWNGKSRLIPVRLIGEGSESVTDKIKQFKPVRVDGQLGFRMLESNPQICVLTRKLRVAERGADIPKADPEWFKDALTKFFNKQAAKNR